MKNIIKVLVSLSITVLVSGYDISAIAAKTLSDKPLSEKKSKTVLYEGANIEYNANPKTYKIENIKFFSRHSFKHLYIRDVVINPQKKITVTESSSEMYHSDINKTGTVTAKLDDKSFNKLIKLLNYIDFPNLKDIYPGGCCDLPSQGLEITYDNGKVKTINDSRLDGTLGLKAVYTIFDK